MNLKKIILVSLCFFVTTSFKDVKGDEIKPKGKLIFQGSLVTKTWIPLHGKINFFVEEKDNNIESISVGGSLLGISKNGSLKINKRKSDTLKITKSIDKEVSIVLDKDFNNKGGKINVTIFMYNKIKHDSLYVVQNFEEKNFELYVVDSLGLQKLESLKILYSLKKGILDYKTNTKKPYE